MRPIPVASVGDPRLSVRCPPTYSALPPGHEPPIHLHEPAWPPAPSSLSKPEGVPFLKQIKNK